MSASEIIEQIKALPADEQRQVFAFVQSATAVTVTERSTARFATDEEAREAGEEVIARYPEVFRRLAE
jgi:hypothetical protein